MKNNPKVSIVVPVYNAENFLSKCLEHLIHQTYKNLEIIIVDDGSTDNVASVYNKYKKQDRRIIIQKQKNAGPSAAQNKGLSLSTGDYIHFHDHDDFVNLDFYELMIDAALKTNSDVLCGEVNQPEYNFPEFDSIEICLSVKDKILKTQANLFNPAWRYLYKKSFLNKIGLKYEEKIINMQDVLFTKPALIMSDSVTLVPNAKYNVVNTETALGKDKEKISKFNNNEEFSKILNKYNKLLSDTGADKFMNVPEISETEELKIFHISVFKKKKFFRKTKYYLFGINIGKKYFNV